MAKRKVKVEQKDAVLEHRSNVVVGMIAERQKPRGFAEELVSPELHHANQRLWTEQDRTLKAEEAARPKTWITRGLSRLLGALTGAGY